MDDPIIDMSMKHPILRRKSQASLLGIQDPNDMLQYVDPYRTPPICFSYPLDWIQRIDMIEKSEVSFWGYKDCSGIISLTLKTGAELENSVSLTPSIYVAIASPSGYQTPAEFYAPAYATEKARRSMVPDYRTTLYWNPSVEFDETGRATVEFYTSDAPADYDITIEGVTRTGKVVRAKQVAADRAIQAGQRGV